MEEKNAVKLPIIDLSAPDRFSTASSIRKACIEFGFFYIVNHGLDKEFLSEFFKESKKFFSIPLEEKMKLSKKEHRGYTSLYAEKLDPTSSSKGDFKEGFYICCVDEACNLNQWPSKDLLPHWRPTMEEYYRKAMSAGTRLLSLFGLALDLDDKFFENMGALDKPSAFLRLLHYPGGITCSDEEVLGASAHSDYGMITLLVIDGVPGLQVCRDKDKHPRVWEDVPHVEGALTVNVGDMTERWTNNLFRSTLHRVIPTGQERYSAAFFFDPPADLMIECIESCCSASNPPRYPPIHAGEYLQERIRFSYASSSQNYGCICWSRYCRTLSHFA